MGLDEGRALPPALLWQVGRPRWDIVQPDALHRARDRLAPLPRQRHNGRAGVHLVCRPQPHSHPWANSLATACSRSPLQ